MNRFDESEIKLLRALNDPLPITPRPFAAIAERCGADEQQIVEKIRTWLADGTIRRFGARVFHRSLGYTANGMSVWEVAGDQVEDAAQFMASLPEVTHCYLRPGFPGWPYNLYAMIHGNSEEDVMAVAARIAENVEAQSYQVLFSIKEFKKSTPRYFAEKDFME